MGSSEQGLENGLATETVRSIDEFEAGDLGLNDAFSGSPVSASSEDQPKPRGLSNVRWHGVLPA